MQPKTRDLSCRQGEVYFKNVPEIGDLKLGFTFDQSGTEPRIFSCYDRNCTPYFCYAAITPKTWMIRKVSNTSQMIAMLHSECSLRDAFYDNAAAFILKGDDATGNLIKEEISGWNMKRLPCGDIKLRLDRSKAARTENLKTREKFTPTRGETYRNEGGGTYLCLSVSSVTPHEAVMQNVKSGWTVTVCGIGIYDDGTIDWDYSKKDGYFAPSSAMWK